MPFRFTKISSFTIRNVTRLYCEPISLCICKYDSAIYSRKITSPNVHCRVHRKRHHVAEQLTSKSQSTEELSECRCYTISRSIFLSISLFNPFSRVFLSSRNFQHATRTGMYSTYTRSGCRRGRAFIYFRGIGRSTGRHNAVETERWRNRAEVYNGNEVPDFSTNIYSLSRLLYACISKDPRNTTTVQPFRPPYVFVRQTWEKFALARVSRR